MRTFPIFLTLSAALALAGCGGNADESGDAEPAASDRAIPNPDEPVSIIRPDVEPPALPPASLEPLVVTIGFPDRGTELSAEAIALLKTVIASPQVATSASIVLRGHSDAEGTDQANLKSSEARANAVADWLVDNGIEGQRIVVIPFGEQNPVQPNALPNGSPNEAGRAANRRVEITIAPITPSAPPIMEDRKPAN